MVSLCLKLKAVAAFLDVEKIKQMKGRQEYYTRSLKPCCHGDQPTRSPDISCVPTQETSRTVIGRRSTCRTALPCSRFLVRASLFLVRRSSVLVRRLINVRSVPVIAAVHQRRTLYLESCSSSHSCLLVVDGGDRSGHESHGTSGQTSNRPYP